jgi:hypothetical protein
MKKSISVKIPKVEFRYSWAYDQEHKLRFTDPLYPSGEKIREYIEKVKVAWKGESGKIMRNLPKLSGLKWRDDSILCYVIGRGVPLSDPLTIPMYDKKTDVFVEKLAHCLTERIIMHPDNLQTRGKFWESMFRSLSDDGVKVSYMIPVNALFKEIMTRFLKRPMDSSPSLLSTNMDILRSWEIVEAMGHSDVIERFKAGKWD